jgi:hypothetical protein
MLCPTECLGFEYIRPRLNCRQSKESYCVSKRLRSDWHAGQVRRTKTVIPNDRHIRLCSKKTRNADPIHELPNYIRGNVGSFLNNR